MKKNTNKIGKVKPNPLAWFIYVTGSKIYMSKRNKVIIDRTVFKNRLLLRWAVILRDANNNFNFLHTIDNPPPKPNLYHSIWKIGCSSHFRIDRALRCRVLQPPSFLESRKFRAAIRHPNAPAQRRPVQHKVFFFATNFPWQNYTVLESLLFV